MQNRISQDFTARSLLRFVAPMVLINLVGVIYSLVDGLFISHFVDTTSLSCTTLVLPPISLATGAASMLSIGGNAFVARLMGQNRKQEARAAFSFLCAFLLGLGTLLAALFLALEAPLFQLLGVTQEVWASCSDYFLPLCLGLPLTMLATAGGVFIVTAGVPELGMWAMLAGGLANIAANALLMGPLHMGVLGAGIGTLISNALPAVVGAVYFVIARGDLHFTRFRWQGALLKNSLVNGTSQMIMQIGNSLIMLLFNRIITAQAGAAGVAAFAIVLYIQPIIPSLFSGYLSGVSPIFSYNFGAQNAARIRWLYRVSMRITAVTALLTFAVSFAFARPLVGLYADPAAEIGALAVRSLRLYVLCIFPNAFNMMAGQLLPAFGKGKAASAITLMRKVILIVLYLALLTPALGLDGTMLATAAAELTCLPLTFFLLRRYGEECLYLPAGRGHRRRER